MPTSGGAGEDRPFPVEIDEQIWRQEVGRYGRQGPPAIARRARQRIEAQGGLRASQLRACAEYGSDGTRLADCLKAYLPLERQEPSRRPFAFVFQVRRGGVLFLVAFGERHPTGDVPSVYVRAHNRVHGTPP